MICFVGILRFQGQGWVHGCFAGRSVGVCFRSGWGSKRRRLLFFFVLFFLFFFLVGFATQKDSKPGLVVRFATKDFCGWNSQLKRTKKTTSSMKEYETCFKGKLRD